MAEACPVCENDLSVIKTDGLEFDYETNVVFVDGVGVLLFPKVFEMLLYLHNNLAEVVTRDDLYEQFFVEDDEVDGEDSDYRSVDSCIKRLRMALVGTKLEVETLYGFGYRLRVNEAKTSSEVIIKPSQEPLREANPYAEDVLKAAQEHTVKKVSRKLRFTKELGEEPEFGYVPVTEVRVDQRYQRPINLFHTKKIVANFHWSKFQPITLARLPEGDFAVIDGQHRWYAAKLHPLVESVPAYIIDLPDLEDQAAAFVDINSKRLGIDPVSIYWASLTAGKPDYIAVHTLITDLDLSVSVNSGANKAKTISAVATLLEVFRRRGEETLRQVLETLDALFPDHPNTFKSTYIRGMAEFLSRYGDRFDIEILKKALSSYNPDSLNAYAKDLKQELKEASVNTLFVELIRRAYNKELSGEDISSFLPAHIEEGKKGKNYYR